MFDTNVENLADLEYRDHGDENGMDHKEGVLYYKVLGYAVRERPPVKMIPGKVEQGTD